MQLDSGPGAAWDTYDLGKLESVCKFGSSSPSGGLLGLRTRSTPVAARLEEVVVCSPAAEEREPSAMDAPADVEGRRKGRSVPGKDWSALALSNTLTRAQAQVHARAHARAQARARARVRAQEHATSALSSSHPLHLYQLLVPGLAGRAKVGVGCPGQGVCGVWGAGCVGGLGDRVLGGSGGHGVWACICAHMCALCTPNVYVGAAWPLLCLDVCGMLCPCACMRRELCLHVTYALPLCMHATYACMRKKSDAARAWIKEAGRMNHLEHSVP